MIGAVVSYHVFEWFGPAAYLLLALAVAWGALLFFRVEVNDIPSRLLGSGLLVLSSAAIVTLAFEGPSASWPAPGGILGIAVSEFLNGKFSRVGTYLVLSVIAALSLVLATDSLLFALAAKAGRSVSDSLRLAWTRLAVRFEEWSAQRSVQAEARRVEMEAAREADRVKLAEVESEAKARYEEELAQLNAQRERIREERERQREESVRHEAEAATKVALEPAPEDDDEVEKPRRKETALRKTTRRITRMLGLGSGGTEAASPEAAQEAAIDLPVPPPPPGSPYELPPTALLEEPERVDPARGHLHAQEKAKVLEKTLDSFKIQARVVNLERGPIVTQYEIEIKEGLKVSTVTALSNDLAMALKAPSIRIQAPIPGKGTIGIEVPNVEKEVVRVKDLMTSRHVELDKMKIPLFLGKMADGMPLVPDLVKMPHLLIAGTTGSGKSVCINTVVSSVLLCRRPEEVKLVLIDPKMVELDGYRNLPHLLTPVVTEMNRASAVLDWAVEKMEERYRVLKDVGVRNIAEYNEMTVDDRRRRIEARGEFPDAYPESLPYIVIVIDELADLMMVARKEVENSIIRLAQKSRAIGIHLILATQRPSADVITGLIKSNLPSRIAFRVNAKGDSRIILDFNGAEKLLGGGDMLFLTPGAPQPVRCQGTYMSDNEIRGLIQYVTAQASPVFSTELDQVKTGGDIDPSQADALFDEAVRIILETQRGSATLLQRRLEIGYSRASRLIDMMEEVGIVGTHRGSKSRDILMTLEEWEGQRATASGAPCDVE